MAAPPDPNFCQTTVSSRPLSRIEDDTRVKLLIEPVRANQGPNHQPTIPFEAYVLIAIITLGGTASMEDLLKMILTLSPYWMGVTMKCCLNYDYSNYSHPAHWLRETLFYYDLPFLVTKQDQGAPVICSVTSIGAALCALRVLLRDRFIIVGSTFAPVPLTVLAPAGPPAQLPSPPASTGATAITTAPTTTDPPNRLMKLPAELRNYIYELVLVYPSSGIHIASDDEYHRAIGSKYIFTKTREHEAVVPVTSWSSNTHRLLDLTSEPSVIHRLRSYKYTTATTLLKLNQEIRKETAGIFFGLNRFHFSSLKELTSFIISIGPNGQHIRRLDFAYDARWRLQGIRAMGGISQLTHLEELSMSIPEAALEKYKHWDEPNKFKGLPELLNLLKDSLPHLKSFKLEDECEEVLHYLKPGLEARSNYQELEFSYQGHEVCKEASCDDDTCTKYHDE